VSLFKRLCEAHPAAVCDLTLQHRMASDIMLLANKLVYSDRLQAATDAVARSSLQVRA
jgi:DNA replication ATP-dependent helicase Dna2